MRSAAAVIVDVVSATIGLGGLILAALANKRAKDANHHAQIANEIAAQGIAQAEEANRVAQEGNHIARDANTVAERAMAATTDHVRYNWRIEVEKDDDVVILRNDSAYPALDLTVVVDEGHHVAATATAEHIPPFGELRLDLDSTLQQHIEQARHHKVVIHGDGFTAFRGPYTFELRFTITAVTEAGVRHHRAHRTHQGHHLAPHRDLHCRTIRDRHP